MFYFSSVIIKARTIISQVICYIDFNRIQSHKFILITRIGLDIQTTTFHGGRSLSQRMIYGFPFRNRRDGRKNKRIFPDPFSSGRAISQLSRSEDLRYRSVCREREISHRLKGSGTQTMIASMRSISSFRPSHSGNSKGV